MRKVADEVLGKRLKSNRKRGLKFWDEEIKEAVEANQRAFKKMLRPTGQKIMRIMYKKGTKLRVLSGMHMLG